MLTNTPRYAALTDLKNTCPIDLRKGKTPHDYSLAEQVLNELDISHTLSIVLPIQQVCACALESRRVRTR